MKAGYVDTRFFAFYPLTKKEDRYLESFYADLIRAILTVAQSDGRFQGEGGYEMDDPSQD